jgi:hypothetical protein
MKEAIRFLRLGYGTLPVPDVKTICPVLEGLKAILLPIVQYMDKPLAEIGVFSGVETTPEFLSGRYMLFFEPDSEIPYWSMAPRRLSVALNRAGHWFAGPFKKTGRERAFYTGMTTLGLAGLLLQRIRERLPSMFELNKVVVKDREPGRGVGFLKDLCVYSGVVAFVSVSCRHTMLQVLKAKEDRLRLIRERLELGGRLAEAMDPLLSGRREAALAEYAIDEKTERGTRREASFYLSENALAPLWAILKKHYPRNMEEGKYITRQYMLQFPSLDELVSRLHVIFNNIGRGDGRLPLIPEEVEVLKALVASIV